MAHHASTLSTFAEFRPTQFDSAGLGAEGQEDWLVVPCSHTRDSQVLDESNFHSALKQLGGESETVSVHRFGHWGPGWFEIITVDPSRRAEVEAIEFALADYPVLDDDDLSEREEEDKVATWNCYSLREKIKLCAEAKISIFGARHDYPPYEVSDRF